MSKTQSKMKTKEKPVAKTAQKAEPKTNKQEKSKSDILGAFAVHDLGFNKGFQNLKFQNVRGIWVKLARWQEDNKNPDKATKGLALLIPKNKINYDKIVKFFGATIEQSEQIPATKKKDIFTDVVKFKKGLFRDGDTYVNEETGKSYPGTEGHLLLQLTSKGFKDESTGQFTTKKPLKLFKSNGEEVRANEASQLFYSGAWFDVECSLTSYKNEFGTGVTTTLGAVMKLLDDENLSGASSSLTAREDLQNLNLNELDEGSEDDDTAGFKFG